MKIVNFNNTTHGFSLIPRYYSFSTIELTLRNEVTKEETLIPISTIDISFTNNYHILNGYLLLKFDFAFLDNDRYSFILKENEEVIYRGLILSITQETQDYKQTNELYKYEF